MKLKASWSRFDAADGLVTEADLADGDPALLTVALDDVERARAKLRGKPRYTLEELLAQCDPNVMSLGEMDWGQSVKKSE